MNEQTPIEKQYFAMRGALQEIANAHPPMTAEQARLLARRVIVYSRHCVVCRMPAAGGEPPVCSEACAKIVREWREAPAFAIGGSNS